MRSHSCSAQKARTAGGDLIGPRRVSLVFNRSFFLFSLSGGKAKTSSQAKHMISENLQLTCRGSPHLHGNQSALDFIIKAKKKEEKQKKMRACGSVSLNLEGCWEAGVGWLGGGFLTHRLTDQPGED